MHFTFKLTSCGCYYKTSPPKKFACCAHHSTSQTESKQHAYVFHCLYKQAISLIQWQLAIFTKNKKENKKEIMTDLSKHVILREQCKMKREKISFNKNLLISFSFSFRKTGKVDLVTWNICGYVLKYGSTLLLFWDSASTGVYAHSLLEAKTTCFSLRSVFISNMVKSFSEPDSTWWKRILRATFLGESSSKIVSSHLKELIFLNWRSRKENSRQFFSAA